MQSAATAKVSHVRISAQKVKIVIDLIRNKPVGQALAILRNTPKSASSPVEKLLLSAVANAENNHNMDVDALYIAEIYANQGPTMKRIQPRAQGRAFRILKRTSHIVIVLKEKEETVAADSKPAEKKSKAKQEEKKSTAKKTTEKKAPAKKATAKTTAKPAAKPAVEPAKAEAAEEGVQEKAKKPRTTRKKAETAAEVTPVVEETAPEASSEAKAADDAAQE